MYLSDDRPLQFNAVTETERLGEGLGGGIDEVCSAADTDEQGHFQLSKESAIYQHIRAKSGSSLLVPRLASTVQTRVTGVTALYINKGHVKAQAQSL